MKTNKRGISLIVLVITVIVLAILASAVIVSLSNNDIITKASDAVDEYNVKQYETQLNLAYASWKVDADNRGKTFTEANIPEEHGFKESDLPAGSIIAVVNGVPVIGKEGVWYGSTESDIDFENSTTIEIEKPEDLAALAKYVNANGNFKSFNVIIKNDLDLNNYPWTPIGTAENPFVGSVDGGNHTIYNINVKGYEYAGLFGIGYGMEMYNLNMQGGSVEGSKYAAPFMSYNNGNGGSLHDLVNVSVNVSSNSENGIAAGIVGNNLVGISDCTNNGNVTSNNGYAFGITSNSPGIVVYSNLINNGKITGKYASGLIDRNGASLGGISNSTNNGDVKGTVAAGAITLMANGAGYEYTNNVNTGTITVAEGGTIYTVGCTSGCTD